MHLISIYVYGFMVTTTTQFQTVWQQHINMHSNL